MVIYFEYKLDNYFDELFDGPAANWVLIMFLLNSIILMFLLNSIILYQKMTVRKGCFNPLAAEFFFNLLALKEYFHSWNHV